MPLSEVIERRRVELGTEGRPLTWEVIAQRAGRPLSSVHDLATNPVRSLTPAKLETLTALAQALEMPAAELKAVAWAEIDTTVIETHVDEEGHELLIASWDKLSPSQKGQVSDYMRFLRSQPQ